MSLWSWLCDLLGPPSLWHTEIDIGGTLVSADVDKINEHGQWHVTYRDPQTTMWQSKWITPTAEQQQGRFKS